MLSNLDIEDICKTMVLPLVGVFSKDKLPDKLYVGSYYINMQNHDEGNGTHWVYLRVDDEGDVLYFDSFGVPPPKEVKEFVKRRHIPYSNRQIQDIDSIKCGFFCIACDDYFTHHYKKKRSWEDNYDDFLNKWSIHEKENDKKVMQYFVNARFM